MVADTYKELFMKHNKPWLQNQLYEVFTPRTLFLYRNEILDQFQEVMGEIPAELSGDDIDEEDDIAPDYDDEDQNNNSQLQKQKKLFKKEDVEKVVKKTTPITRAIIKYWVIRARFRQKVTIEVTKVVDYLRKPYCLFCRTTSGLKVEIVNNIEDLFYKFLRQKKQNMITYKIVDWQRFFAKNGSTRTLCLSCQSKIEAFNADLKRKLNKNEVIEEDGDDIKDEEDDHKQQLDPKDKIRAISEGAKRVIRFWH